MEVTKSLGIGLAEVWDFHNVLWKTCNKCFGQPNKSSYNKALPPAFGHRRKN